MGISAGAGSHSGNIRIDIREDGVYLILDNPENGERASQKDVLRIIEDFQLSDADFAALNEALKDSSPHLEVEISDNKNIAVKNEEVSVSLSKDNMEASIRFLRPGYNGKIKSFDEVLKDIGLFGVRYGIDKEELADMISHKVYGRDYVIARGLPCVDGVDGYLAYKFDVAKKSSKPKVLEDGRVDFHNLDYFESVTAGQELVIAHPPVPGKNGINVLGQEIAFKPGKPAPKLPKGKNVKVVGENEMLVAEASGQLLYLDNKVTISPVMEIKGDVGNSTGNINFMGSVLVRGNVLTGFSVKATDSIEVMGVVEGAAIQSDMDITLYNGVQGADKAKIISGGSITVKFAESCTLDTKGDIFAGSIMHSTVQCGGSLLLEGKKSILVGGRIRVGRMVKARVIGSVMATATEINVGNPPEMLEEYESKTKEMEEAKKEYDNMAKICDVLTKLNEKNMLTREKKDLLLKSMHTKQYLRDKIIGMREQMNAMVTSSLSAGRGAVYASEVIRSGVRILIGGAVLHVRDDIQACRLTNAEGKIKIDSYTGE